MKTMGASCLMLVAPVAKFPSAEASRRAAGAEDVLQHARVHVELEPAINDCRLIIGATARKRAVDWPLLSPAQAAEKIVQESHYGPVALLFGQERSGLVNLDVERCHFLVCIPTHPDYTSLNLASAAQIMAYELFLKASSGSKNLVTDNSRYAEWEQMYHFYKHLEQVLMDIDFPNTRPPVKLLRKLTRLFNRARLTREEIQILRGIFSAVQQRVNKRFDKV